MLEICEKKKRFFFSAEAGGGNSVNTERLTTGRCAAMLACNVFSNFSTLLDSFQNTKILNLITNRTN